MVTTRRKDVTKSAKGNQYLYKLFSCLVKYLYILKKLIINPVYIGKLIN